MLLFLLYVLHIRFMYLLKYIALHPTGQNQYFGQRMVANYQIQREWLSTAGS